MMDCEVTEVKNTLQQNALQKMDAQKPGVHRGLRLVLASLLALTLLGCALPALGGEALPPEPLCFDGAAEYTYADDQLWINIQKRFVSEPALITYFVCDVQTTNPAALHSALSSDKPNGPREATADIALRHSAKLAVNGDGYDFHNRAIIIRNGEVVRAKKSSNHHLLLLDANGDFSIVTDRGGEDAETYAAQLAASGVSQVWAFGPTLVLEGEAFDYKGFSLISVRDGIREPRTAIGQIGPLHYVVVVADGRRKDYSEGMTLPELQQVFLDAGAQIAFNLDGGGSSTLFFCGEVLNKPAGGAERAVSDILIF